MNYAKRMTILAALVILVAGVSVYLSVRGISCLTHWTQSDQTPSLPGGSSEVSGTWETQLLPEVLAALEKSTQFFEQDYSAVNVDGLFGIRLCQGSLVQAIQDCETSGFHCPEDVVNKLRKMNLRLNTTGAQAIPIIQEESKDYYKSCSKLVEAPLLVNYLPEQLSGNTPVGNNQMYNYALGTDCMAQLLGTDDSQRCTISDQCWTLMGKNDTVGYYVTHQVLYFIVAELSGCLGVINERALRTLGTSVRNRQRYWCDQIYVEAVQHDLDGIMEIYREDLFLEETVLCGILGFENFFSRKWMKMVLSWQTPDGCFVNPPELTEVGRREYPVLTNSIDVNRKLKQAYAQKNWTAIADLTAQQIDLQGQLNLFSIWKETEAFKIDKRRGVHTMRQLKMEKVMAGGCLAHKTGLAFGTLGVYARFLIKQLYTHQ